MNDFIKSVCYENSTKTKIPKTHRISVGFTHEEYVSIVALADEKRISKSQLLHDKMLGTHVTRIPQIT